MLKELSQHILVHCDNLFPIHETKDKKGPPGVITSALHFRQDNRHVDDNVASPQNRIQCNDRDEAEIG